MSSTANVVEVRRRMKASRSDVFAAFANAELVARWLRPSTDVKLSVLAFEFRVGGAYCFAYDVPAGHRVIVRGTFRAIETATRIVFSWVIDPPDEHAGIESEVTVTLSAAGAATELMIRHAKFDRADAEARHAEGWRGALELLDGLLQNAEVHR